ncbi:MAG: CAP domain-containing protein [Jiangellaceae bacterium]
MSAGRFRRGTRSPLRRSAGLGFLAVSLVAAGSVYLATRADDDAIVADSRAPAPSSAGTTTPGASTRASTPAPTVTITTPPPPTPTPTPTRTQDPKPPPPPEPVSEAAGLETGVVEATNAVRADAGCGPLHVEDQLTAAARAHSRDMRVRDFFSHENPDGESPWDRAGAAGYGSLAAENIAMGQQDVDAVMEAWMKSPGHRKNILNCDDKAIGVGVELGDGGPWWTQMFGYE